MFISFSVGLEHEYYWSLCIWDWGFLSLVLTSSYFDPAAGNPQKCSRSCGRCDIRTYHLHVCGCGGREHVGIQNLPKDSCYRRRLALPMLLPVLLFLSSSMSLNPRLTWFFKSPEMLSLTFCVIQKIILLIRL